MRRWLPAVLWAAVLFVLSSVPGDAYPQVPLWSADKIVHVMVYAPLGAASLWALWRPNGPRRRQVVVAALLATAYGVTDECHQWFVPRRSADWHDVVADAAGGLLGALAASRWLGRRA